MAEILSPLLAFWARIAEAPADCAPRLVFCDWLEEQAAGADAGRRRTLEVVLAGQRWQVSRGKWPGKTVIAYRKGGRGRRAEYGWTAYGSDSWCDLPADVADVMADQTKQARLFRYCGQAWFSPLAAAEWAVAAALDRLAWQAKRDGVNAILGRVTADLHLAAVMTGKAEARVPDVPRELLPGLLDYEPPAPPFA